MGPVWTAGKPGFSRGLVLSCKLQGKTTAGGSCRALDGIMGKEAGMPEHSGSGGSVSGLSL